MRIDLMSVYEEHRRFMRYICNTSSPKAYGEYLQKRRRKKKKGSGRS